MTEIVLGKDERLILSEAKEMMVISNDHSFLMTWPTLCVVQTHYL